MPKTRMKDLVVLLPGIMGSALQKDGKDLWDVSGQAIAQALKARGKADLGYKTMLDVLGPLADHLGSGGASFASIRKLAAESAAATVPMKAIRGRASFLGERSIGHMDPGARSSQIMIDAVCDVLEGEA